MGRPQKTVSVLSAFAEDCLICSAGVHCGGHLPQHGCRQCRESLPGLSIAYFLSHGCCSPSCSPYDDNGLLRHRTDWVTKVMCTTGTTSICGDAALLRWVSCPASLFSRRNDTEEISAL